MVQPLFPVAGAVKLVTDPVTGAIGLPDPAVTSPQTPDLSSYAKKTDIPVVPVVSTVVPPPAGLNGQAGTQMSYARADHTHEVKVQRISVTTDATGSATWTFAKAFVGLPVLAYMVVETNGGLLPVQVKVTAKSTTSVTINAVRLAILPTLNLGGFNVASGSAAGVTIDLFAAEATQ